MSIIHFTAVFVYTYECVIVSIFCFGILSGNKFGEIHHHLQANTGDTDTVQPPLPYLGQEQGAPHTPGGDTDRLSTLRGHKYAT